MNDKFLVQMALVDFESIPGWAREKITNDQLGLEEIQMIWDQIDKKQLVSYKLRVDVDPEVNDMLVSHGLEALPTLKEMRE